MSEQGKGEVTRLLEAGALDELLPLVYSELKAIAERRMGKERSGHTLQATALVHEVWMRIGGGEEIPLRNREQFFAVAAESMRRILIDWARKRGSQKRGGGKAGQPLEMLDLAADHDPLQVLALMEALDTLAAEDERAARVVKLRYFAGLSLAETVAATGLSERTVVRDWEFARARLFELLSGEPGKPG
jgi:RNA polymerase sigma factor (TIGR02999 family)